MGRYCAERTIVRHTSDLQIIFRDKYSIYVESSMGRYVFHRWYAPRGSYGGWHIFRQSLLTRRRISLSDIFEWANANDILFERSYGRIKLAKKDLEIRFGKIKILGASDEL